MELILTRKYAAEGTDGLLSMNGIPVCFTIELPWRDNKKEVSCIPEGHYKLEKRNSARLKKHILVKNVPGRSLILIHAANNAELELKGCIAPVSRLTKPGNGENSRQAFNQVLKLVYDALDAGDTVTLIITSI